MITLKKAKGIVFIAVSLLIASLLTACPDAGAGAAAAAGDGNGEEPGPFVRADANVSSTTVAWSSQNPTTGSLASDITGNGPYTLTVSDNVNAIHAVVVGGGGGAYHFGGGAGYIRAGGFTVEPGEVLTLSVGAGGGPQQNGHTTSIVAGSDTIMSAQGGGGGGVVRVDHAGNGSGGGGAHKSNGGYCANGGAISIGVAGIGGNNPAKSSGFGTAPADCRDAKSGVKYGAGGGSRNSTSAGWRGGTGGTATGAGVAGASSSTSGTAGANHYGAGGGGSDNSVVLSQMARGGKGVIVLYVD